MYTNLLKSIIVAFLFFGTISCISNKNIKYFQSADTSKIISLKNIIPKNPKIQPNDILAVIVSTYNKESNEILNFANISTLSLSVFSGSNVMSQGRQPLGYRVDSTGFISMPFIGKQKVAELTLEQAESQLKVEIEKVLKDPSVSIRFLNHKFTVLGEVNKVGTYNLVDNKTTLIEALSSAGDLTVYGDRTNVMVIRNNNGIKETAKLNLLTYEIFNSPYFYVQNEDIIYIEPTRGKVTFTDQRIQLIPIITGVATTFVLLLNFLFK
ncbi:polysaccharide biosynthesis/export family protein [Emticicia sp. 17c]|uniref:polysaccharide biosynthesis/export family protein n=1 Tax=Emticicia sp. 17c TaxID=3127704 RepID=UPI00301BE573